MIKTLKIQNFESWKDAEIEFHPGINVLVGESDQGKSGLIRALKWNFLNRPQGFAYRSDFTEEKQDLTLVETTLDSDDKICRQRNLSGKNEYLVNNEPLIALRTDVPDEVSDLTKISEINIQGQHPSEQYFLLSERPGYVAKEFNKVSGLSIMDDALSEINSQVRSTNSEIKIIQKEIDTKKELIQENEWIEKAIKFTIKLKKLEEDIISQENLINEIVYPLINLEKIKKKLIKYKNIPNALKVLKKDFEHEQQTKQKEQEAETIKKLVLSIKKTILKLNETQSIHEALKALKSQEKLTQKINEQEQKYIQLKSIIKSIEKNKTKCEEIEKEIEKYEKVFHHKLKTEKCPICGRIG